MDSCSNAAKQKPSLPISHEPSFSELNMSWDSSTNPSTVTPEKATNPNLFTTATNKKYRHESKEPPQPLIIPDHCNMLEASDSRKRSASTDQSDPTQITTNSAPNGNDSSADEADTEDNLFPDTADITLVSQACSGIELHAPHLLQQFESQVNAAMTTQQLKQALGSVVEML
jgi:hypothetical protein